MATRSWGAKALERWEAGRWRRACHGGEGGASFSLAAGRNGLR